MEGGKGRRGREEKGRKVNCKFRMEGQGGRGKEREEERTREGTEERGTFGLLRNSETDSINPLW